MVALPFADLAVTGLPTFALGVVVGWLLERHKEKMMSLPTRSRAWYDKWAPLLFAAIAVLAAAGIWVGAVATVTNARQDAAAQAENRERDRDTAQLLECFDEYAAAQSESSVAVREAAVEVDKATTLRDDALNAEGVAFKNLVRDLLADEVSPDQFQHLLATLQVRAEAGRKLDQAQDDLDDARTENPVPPPPSEFCNVKN